MKKRPLPASASIQQPKMVGGFVLEDSDDENADNILEPLPKRQMLDEHRSPPLHPIRATEERSNGAIKTIYPGHLQRAVPKTLAGFLIEDDEEEVESAASAKQVENSTEGQLPKSLTEERHVTKPSMASFLYSHFEDRREIRTCSGKSTNVIQKQKAVPVTFEELVAARSTTKSGRAKKSYYGIDIHQLVEEAVKENVGVESRKSKVAELPLPSTEHPPKAKSRRTMMWTEKYRARRFFDLVEMIAPIAKFFDG